jgi:hypothetical protein
VALGFSDPRGGSNGTIQTASPSPALVVSLVALMVALGGVAKAEFTSNVQHRLFDKLGDMAHLLRDTNADQNGDSARELAKLDRLLGDLKAHEDRLNSVQGEVEDVLVRVILMDRKLGDVEAKLASVDVEQRDVVEPVLGALCAGEDDLAFGTQFATHLHGYSDKVLDLFDAVTTLAHDRRWNACNAVLPVPSR